MNTALARLLIVEDEPHDVEFLRRALTRSGVVTPIHDVENGEQALGYLQGLGRYADRAAFPLPRLIITDLKMPQMNGIELLRWIQAHPAYRAIPTIVLSSSTNESDVNAAFEAGARGYMVKPVGFDQLLQLAKVIADYWRASLVPEVR